MSENEIREEELQTCYIELGTGFLGGIKNNVEIKLSPKDTGRTFVEKIAEVMFKKGIAKNGDFISKMGSSRLIPDLMSEDFIEKPLTEIKSTFNRINGSSAISLWDHLKKSTNRDLFPIAVHMNLKTKDGVPKGFKIDFQEEDLGELPVYEVVTETDPADPHKRINKFKATSESIKLSERPDEIKLNGFGLGPKEILEVNNLLYIYICSPYLKDQNDRGILTNAKGVREHQIGGFDNMSEDSAKKNNKTVEQVYNQEGWQGINRNDYVEVHYNGNGVNRNVVEFNHAEDWLKRLSNILADKAYLSDDKNLDTLILAADKLYKNKKISFEQFQNVILMLRYAYELRKLPNEKGGKLKSNSDIDQMQLSDAACKIIAKILNETNNGFGEILNDLDSIIANCNLTMEFQSQVFENKRKKSKRKKNKRNRDECDLMSYKGTELVVNCLELQKQLEEKSKTMKLEYKKMVVAFMLNKRGKNPYKSNISKSSRNWYRNMQNERNVVLENEDIVRFANEIENLYEKSDFDKFIEETKFYAKEKGNEDFDPNNGKGKDKVYYQKACYGDSACFFVEDFLSDGEKERLSKQWADINEISSKLEKVKKVTNSEPFKKASEYSKVFLLARYTFKHMKPSKRLSWWEWVLGMLYSLMHKQNRTNKIASGKWIDYGNNKCNSNMFVKSNGQRKSEETVLKIPKSLFIELYNR